MRANPFYSKAKFVIFVESNSDYQKTDLYAAVIKMIDPYCEVVSTDKKNRAGVRTTEETKEAALPELQERLELETIHVARSLVSKDGMGYLRELYLQLGRFMRNVKKPKTPFEQTKSTLGGKANGQQDDIAMSLQQLLIQSKEYRKRHVYYN